jgi:hypothetical protein
LRYRGLITVGHGRGFVVEGAGERLVITAAPFARSSMAEEEFSGLSAVISLPTKIKVKGNQNALSSFHVDWRNWCTRRCCSGKRGSNLSES